MHPLLACLGVGAIAIVAAALVVMLLRRDRRCGPGCPCAADMRSMDISGRGDEGDPYVMRLR